MKIIIKERFKNDFTTREAGEQLRKMILSSSEKIIIDFADVKIASASFFDEGIAKLAHEGWNKQDLDSRIEFINIFSKDLELMHDTCLTRGIK